MFSKIVWCYVLILTLLDISSNTYLSAQGKSYDDTNLHDTFAEGVTFQEWGAESTAREGADEGGAVRLVPAALRLGRVPLAAPRAVLVTLLNRGNTTLHLASVAGTTPDFHASFFHSKTVPPDGNTTFSVVYLGRREGLVSAHLYIHTSLGVHKYPVSAVGVANEYEVWPMVSLRVPHNATLSALLTLTNPTDSTIQIREVYSSGSWVGLQLPEGGASAPPLAWRIPPRARRPLVRLHIAPRDHALHTTAYIRIKANVSLSGDSDGDGAGGGGGGGLVVAVEAARAPAGEHAAPPHVRLRARGTGDPTDTVEISLGNSGEQHVQVRGEVWGARCLPAPHHPPPPPVLAAADAPAPARTANGAKHSETAWEGGGVEGAAGAGGARVSVLTRVLEPHREPLAADATLTLHYGKMWAEYSSGTANGDSHAPDGNGAPRAPSAGGAWCAGWVRLGAAALPYSVRLLPGTVALEPASLDIVTASRAEAAREHEARVRNEFAVPLHVTRVEVPPAVSEYLQVEVWEGFTLGAGEAAVVARVTLKPSLSELHDPEPALDAALTVHTNVSAYTLPLRIYTGLLHLEWDWPNSADGTLRVGALGTSSTRRVRALVRNSAPAPLALTRLRAALPGATLAVPRCAACLPDRDCHCVVCAGCVVEAWLTLVAPARPGAQQGAVWLHTPHGSSAHAVTLSAHAGRVAVLPPDLPPAAPYAWSTAELVVESSMALRMRVTELASARAPPDPAFTFLPGERTEFEAGRWAVGRVRYAPERLCEPRCYTGMPPDNPETAAWMAREGAVALRADAALAAARLALFRRAHTNLTLLLHTTQVVQIPVAGGVSLAWPRLARGGGADARLASVGAATPLRLPLRNPSRSHALLLQPTLLAAPPLLPPALNEEGETAFCQKEKCVLSDTAFSLKSWRTLSGEAREWRAGLGAGARAGDEGGAGAMLLLAPSAEIELELEFTPQDALPLTTYLYLRNNLTVLESTQLAGRGAFPSFRLGERAPGDADPIALEVTECEGAAARTLVVLNTGLVPLRLREWRVAGAACAARGFRVQPCAPFTLPPNGTRALTLAFHADWTLARAAARLSVRSDTQRHEFLLRAAVPPRVRDQCAARMPRPPFERALRSAARLLALAVLALVLAAAALDAERLLRRARASRCAPRAPLDLRALAVPPRPAPAPPAPPPPPPRRRRARKLDPLAESRAFERWRASLRRADDDSERSSEDADDMPPARRPRDPADDEPPSEERRDRDSPQPTDEPPHTSGDDDASTGSDTSTGTSCSPVEADDAEPLLPAESEPVEERPHSPLGGASDDARPEQSSTPPDSEERPTRRSEPSPRRTRRADVDHASRTRNPLLKHHARKEKGSKRRERAPACTLRASPAGGGAGDARPVSGGVRVGASWSSVVARREPPAQPPPVGADRRTPLRAAPTPPAPPAPPPAGDNSLFYFNGEAAAREFAWREPPPHPSHPSHPPHPSDVAGFAPSTRDYLGGSGGGAEGGGNAFGSIGPVLWGDSLAARAPGAVWPWGYHPPVRPPPGFGAGVAPGAGAGPGAGPGARGAVRAFDPFHSLASIWARGALDWRGDDERAHE